MRSSLCALGVFMLVIGSACSSADQAAAEDGDGVADAAPGSGGAGGSVGSGGSAKAGSAGAAGKAQGSGGSVGTGGAKGTGGASGSGGSVGTGGSQGKGGDGGPHTVGKCDGLGAVGQWENVTPPGLTLSPPYTGALTVLVNPQVAGTVYLMTSNGGVFKSTDCGATWTKTNTGRSAKELDSGLIWSAVIDPIHPDTLWALTGYGPAGLWKSTNGGVDWDQTLPTGTGMPGFVARVSMDPTDPLHLIINFHDNCTGGHAAVCFGETKDGAATWKVLDFPPSIKNGWGEGTAVMPMDATHWLYSNWELYYTADAGSTWKQVAGGAAFDVTYFQAPDGKYYIGAQNGVFTSPDGSTWSQIPNSGHGLDVVIGDGARLFGIVGFYAPSGTDFVWTAPYTDPTHWTLLATPGLPSPLAAGSNGASYDADHHVLYTANQGVGLWRTVTR